jgi:hypothetical protein
VRSGDALRILLRQIAKVMCVQHFMRSASRCCTGVRQTR